MTAFGPSPVQDGVPSISAYLPRLLRAKWLGLIALGVGLAGTAVWVFSTHRLYQSEVVLAYERGVVGPAEADSARQVGLRVQDSFSSRQRLTELIKELKLYPKLVDRRGLVEASDEMRAHIKVQLREGFTYRVSYDADSPERAQKVLERLANSVVQDEAQRKMRAAEEAKRFLDKEHESAEADVKAKEEALAGFLSKHPQLATEMATVGGTIRAADRDRSSTNMAEVASLEMQSAQIEEALAQAMKTPVRAGSAAMHVQDPEAAATAARAATELRTARKDLAEKQARYTDDHPDVKAALWRVKQAEVALHQAEAAAAAATTTTPATADQTADGSSDGRVAALRRSLAAIRAQIAASHGRSAPKPEVSKGTDSMVATETEWTRLSRSVSEAHERLQQIEARQFPAQLAATLVAANQAGGLLITDPPFRPTRPITGGRAKIAMMGVAGSLGLALALMFIAAVLDRRIYASQDIARVVRTEILIVPRLKAGRGG